MTNAPAPASAAAQLGDTARNVMRSYLFDCGFPTTCRRIQALVLHFAGEFITIEVGADLPDGDPVMTILESSQTDMFFVCTPEQMARRDAPYVLALGARGWVVEG